MHMVAFAMLNKKSYEVFIFIVSCS